MAKEECQKCKDIDYDRRTLEMGCFYDMLELDIPFTVDEARRLYTLRVCKDCRASWMKAIKDWFNGVEPIPPSCGSGIFIREFGSNKEVTTEEFERLRCANERQG